jgi:hypothetical protein
MCIEVSTIFRAEAADFQVGIWRSLRQVPRCVHYHAQGLRLETFQNFYVGNGSCTPELYSVSPNWLEYGFIDEVCCLL